MKRKARIVLEYTLQEILALIRKDVERQEKVTITDITFDPASKVFQVQTVDADTAASPQLFKDKEAALLPKGKRKYGLKDFITELFIDGKPYGINELAKTVSANGFRSDVGSLRGYMKKLGITEVTPGTWQLVVTKTEQPEA